MASPRDLALAALADRVAAADLQQADRLSREGRQDLYAVLGRLGLVGQEAWAEAISRALDLPYLSVEALAGAPVLDQRISPDFQLAHKVVALSSKTSDPFFALADPTSEHVRKALTLALGRAPRLAVALERDIDRLLGEALEIAALHVADESASSDTPPTDIAQLRDLAAEAPVVRFVNDLIAKAVRERASDIHVEPHARGARVRLRIDGLLSEVGEIRPDRLPAVLSRIKILARLDIAEQRMPQDGRFRSRMEGRDIDMRVATGPSLHGESIVLRLLEQDARARSLAELGMRAPLEQAFTRALQARDGLLLITGPTGSGKTTTLYAALHKLNAAERKIITVEDPVERQIDGAVQIEVKPEIGRTFATILRSVLRHNPDIVMVGELRDPETAAIAVQAAMTGHLVLATLHTNDAVSAAPRLLDFGVEPYLLSSVLRAVLAQRLVRRVCPACRKFGAPDARTTSLYKAAGLAPPKRIALATGCPKCRETGYQGRLAVHELFLPSEAALRLVHDRADATRLLAEARAGGMKTLVVEALAAASAGEITIEEIARVLSLNG